MNNADSYIIVGKIGSTYGVHGWLKIHSYTELSASILDYSSWYLSYPENAWQLVQVEEGKVQGKNILVKLADINTPEEARLLTGKLIAIPRAQLPALKPDEYYWSDLKGLTVINQNGDVLGTVSYLIETGSNDVLVVKGNKEHAIPYLPGSVVVHIDLVKKEIHVNWDILD